MRDISAAPRIIVNALFIISRMNMPDSTCIWRIPTMENSYPALKKNIVQNTMKLKK